MTIAFFRFNSAKQKVTKKIGLAYDIFLRSYVADNLVSILFIQYKSDL